MIPLSVQTSPWMAIPRALIDCDGPDTIKFLHSLLSQDVASLAVGERKLSFLLTAQGKIVALMGVTRAGEDWIVLDTEPSYGAALHEMLSRYRIRTKSTLRLHPDVLCPARFISAHGDQTGSEFESSGTSHFILDVDVLGVVSGPTSPDPGVAAFDQHEFDRRRVDAGWPSHGCELTDDTIPNELPFLTDAVNFRKGCYVGQELVERIDSRGGTTPFRLRRVLFDDRRVLDDVANADSIVCVGAALATIVGPDDRDGGVVSGLAVSSQTVDGSIDAVDAPVVGLARVHRRITTNDAITVRTSSGERYPARVER